MDGKNQTDADESLVRRILQGERSAFDALVEKYESQRSKPWRASLPADFRERMLNGITGFELPIERIEGKFKLGQNRPQEDRRGTIEGLETEGNEWGDLATFMRRYAGLD